MKLMAVLVIGLAIQAGTALTPNQIMERVVTRSIADTKQLRENYHFDVIKDETISKDEKRVADRLTIEELFRNNRYLYELSDIIPLNGFMVFVIHFSPKPDNQLDSPKGSGIRGKVKNDILNHLRGIVYVEKEGFGVIRVVTHADKSSSSIFKVGRLYKMDAILEQTPLNDIWAPKEIHVDSEFSYFLGWKRSRENTTILFQNFRPRAP